MTEDLSDVLRDRYKDAKEHSRDRRVGNIALVAITVILVTLLGVMI